MPFRGCARSRLGASVLSFGVRGRMPSSQWRFGHPSAGGLACVWLPRAWREFCCHRRATLRRKLVTPAATCSSRLASRSGQAAAGVGSGCLCVCGSGGSLSSWVSRLTILLGRRALCGGVAVSGWGVWWRFSCVECSLEHVQRGARSAGRAGELPGGPCEHDSPPVARTVRALLPRGAAPGRPAPPVRHVRGGGRPARCGRIEVPGRTSVTEWSEGNPALHPARRASCTSAVHLVVPPMTYRRVLRRWALVLCPPVSPRSRFPAAGAHAVLGPGERFCPMSACVSLRVVSE